MGDPIDLDGESNVDGASSKTKETSKDSDKRKSECWNHFWDVRDPNTGKVVQAKCKYCDNLLTYKANNGTSSMRKHLNSCAKYPLNVKNSISSIRGAVRYVRSSPSRAKLFDECAKRVKVLHKGLVCLDVTTRWNSTYLILENALKFEKVFDRYKEDDNEFKKEVKDGVPSRGDWAKTKVLVICLKRFYEATKKMSVKKLYPREPEKVNEMYNHISDVLRRLFAFYAASSTSHHCSTSSMNIDGNNQVGTVNNENMKKLYDEFDEEEIDDAGGNMILSEYDFSTSGRVLYQFRSSLGPKTMEVLICAQDWLRASNICMDIEQLLEDVQKYEEVESEVQMHHSIRFESEVPMFHSVRLEPEVPMLPSVQLESEVPMLPFVQLESEVLMLPSVQLC
ncbi:hypothetical protein F3Y22_tig00111164pilonHSYRG00049 [Hibiscus syriacus]|uniref:BED-type domain-containing protein n=1 Tax=Hibiscus syriacus TaxID=106335 RepID=A0A6A2YYF9_HIBSY|nr:hypothetical protein F3Y22_tig00111164pilonHSYRG00049 [Hibiscus syriacus]